MAPRPKPEKNPVFTERFWDRPIPQDRGDASGDLIAQAVGYALSHWEQADQALADLFVRVTEISGPITISAVRRAYGSIESNTGRRNAVLAAGEIYFGAYWNNKHIKQSLVDIINAVQWGSKRRDDIAHGIIWGLITVAGVGYGAFLMPPEYNTGRTHASVVDEPDPLRFTKTKYRYTSKDIWSVAEKFMILRKTINDYNNLIRREDGRFPALEAALESVMDATGKKK